MTEAKPLLLLRAASIERGGRALLTGINLQLNAGDLLLISGRNGSGKSTLLRAMAGLVALSQGTRELAEVSLLYWGHLLGLKQELTALENAAQLLAAHPIAPKQIEASLLALGLSKQQCQLPTHYLSAGQKRRIALLRLRHSQDAVWLLDEPTTALDQAAQAQLLQAVNQHRERGGAVVVVHHSPWLQPATQSLDLDHVA
jgi:heme exporter protein A